MPLNFVFINNFEVFPEDFVKSCEINVDEFHYRRHSTQAALRRPSTTQQGRKQYRTTSHKQHRHHNTVTAVHNSSLAAVHHNTITALPHENYSFCSTILGTPTQLPTPCDSSKVDHTLTAATVITRLPHLLHPHEGPTPAPRLRHLLQVTFFSLQVRGNFLVRLKRRSASPRPLASTGTKVLLFLSVSLMLHSTPSLFRLPLPLLVTSSSPVQGNTSCHNYFFPAMFKFRLKEYKGLHKITCLYVKRKVLVVLLNLWDTYSVTPVPAEAKFRARLVKEPPLRPSPSTIPGQEIQFLFIFTPDGNSPRFSGEGHDPDQIASSGEFNERSTVVGQVRVREPIRPLCLGGSVTFVERGSVRKEGKENGDDEGEQKGEGDKDVKEGEGRVQTVTGGKYM